MKDLGADARSLVEASRLEDQPTLQDRERIERKLALQLSALAATTATISATSAHASSAASGVAGGTVGGAIGKLVLVSAVTIASGVLVALPVMRPSEDPQRQVAPRAERASTVAAAESGQPAASPEPPSQPAGSRPAGPEAPGITPEPAPRLTARASPPAKASPPRARPQPVGTTKLRRARTSVLTPRVEPVRPLAGVQAPPSLDLASEPALPPPPSALPAPAPSALPAPEPSAPMADVPEPDVPKVAPPAPAMPALARETALLSAARRALAGGDASRALALSRAHAFRFPHGVLADERRTLHVLSLCALGRRAEGMRVLRAIDETSTSAALIEGARRACERTTP